MSLTIQFIKAIPVNPGRDGMDVMYSYQASDVEQVRIIHVVGSQNSWNMTPGEKHEYAQVLFTGIVAYIKRYWARFGTLPLESEEVHERLDFLDHPEQPTAWENYTLDLE